jgi:hypothetical protein
MGPAGRSLDGSYRALALGRRDSGRAGDRAYARSVGPWPRGRPTHGDVFGRRVPHRTGARNEPSNVEAPGDAP